MARMLRRAGLPLLVAVAAFVLAAPGAKEEATPDLPDEAAFHRHVLDVIATYPTDGTHGYYWPKSGDWLGFTQTLRYEGKVLGKGDAKGRCHCCGLTFEVFFRAWERWQMERKKPFRILDLDLRGMRTLVSDWFGASGDRATLHTAITKRKLGRRITDGEKAKKGDFVQLWRHSGSGHSVVFLGWVREKKKIVGIRYWSTQSTTKGIGEREERFGTSGSTVKPDELYVVRVGRPPRPERAPASPKR